MSGFDAEAISFLAAQKIAAKRLRWNKKNHPDWSQAKVRVDVSDKSGRRGVMVLTAHLMRIPRKYSFALIFRDEAILRLDIEPGHFHTNKIDLRQVKGTHWHKMPNMEEAIPDKRILDHERWFKAFCREANIEYPFDYREPKHKSREDANPPVQLVLEYGQGNGK